MNPQPLYQQPTSALPKGWVVSNEVQVGESKWRLIFGYTAFMLLAIPILRYICLPSVPFDQQILGYVLFGVCTFPIITHFSGRRPGVPVFPIICLVYAMSYALPVFHSPPILLVNTRRGYVRILDEYTLDAIGMAILGVSSMILGFWFFRFSLLNVLVPKVQLELDPKKGKSLATFMGLGSVGFMMIWVGGVINVPAQFLALVALLCHFSTLSIAYLYYEFLQKRTNFKDNLILVLLVVLAFGIGMSMGTVRNASEPLIAIAAVQWTVKQKISWKWAIIGVVLFFAIQSIKGVYRSMLAQAQGEKTSMAERVKIMQTVIEIGIDHYLHPNEAKVAGAGDTASALSRTDIIHLFAHTISKTPRVVPYQYGETYNYFLYAFIPRAIWKNKPSAQVANEFFGVAYELQDASNIGTTSIGMAHLVEAYINFGGFGVFFVMLILGMFYAAIDQIFSHAKAGGGCIAIYSTMLFNLINIETATAPTFGAIVQTIAIYIVVLRTARVRKVTP